jgi:hypothetical protein
MYGNDRVRFCGQCNLNVYNLSAITREEAEDLIRRTEGRLCVRFYRRADGTILTKNCPLGLKAIKDRLTGTSAHIIAALLSLLAYIGLLSFYRGARPYSENRTVETTGVLEAPRIYTSVGQVFMGVLPPAPDHQRSESFIRRRAVFKVTPVFHSVMPALTKSTNLVVAVTISEEGEVINAVCRKGPPVLRGISENAARRWKFKPILINGNPVRVESTLTFRFQR